MLKGFQTAGSMHTRHVRTGSGWGLEILALVANWSKNIHSKFQVCSCYRFISVLKPKFGICVKLLLFSDPATYSNNSYSTFTWCSGSSLLISYHTSTLCYMYNDVVLTACVTLRLAHNILHSTNYIASFPGRLPPCSLDRIHDLEPPREAGEGLV